MKKNDRTDLIKELRGTGRFQMFNGQLFVKTTEHGWIPNEDTKYFDLYQNVLKHLDGGEDMESSDIKAVINTLMDTVEKQYLTNKTTIYTPTQSIDVLTGKIMPNKHDGVQLGIKYNYDKDMSPVAWWDEMVAKTLVDADSIKAYYEMLGLSMIADKSMEVSYWFTGAAGTGKSTVVSQVINAIHHDYNTTAIQPEDWNSKSQQFYQLANKLVNISSDSSNHKKLETGVFKVLVSGEMTQANRKYLNPIKFANTALLVSVGNDMPVITEKGEGAFRRMIPIPMNVKIKAEERNTSVKNWITDNKDGVLDYIVSKAIAHVIAVYAADKPTIPATATQYLDEIKDDNSIVRQWLKSDDAKEVVSLHSKKEYGLKFGAIAAPFNSWAEQNGYKSVGARAITKQVRYAIQTGIVNDYEIYTRNNATYLRSKSSTEMITRIDDVFQGRV